MAAAQTAAALPSHRVDLVDEHDGRGLLLGLLEQVADAAGAHAHIHLHKIGAGDGQERGVGLARHGLGQQRLAGARRPHQQHALGNVGAQLGVFAGVAQELDDLLQLLLLLVGAGHVLERDLLTVVGDILNARLAEARHLVVDRAASAGTGDQVHQQDERHDRQHIGQQRGKPVGAVAGRVVVAGDDALVGLLHHQIVQVAVKCVKALQGAGGGAVVLQDGSEPIVRGGEASDLLLHEAAAHLAVADIPGAAQIARHLGDQHHRRDDQQNGDAAEASLCIHLSLLPLLSRSSGRPASSAENRWKWPPACAPEWRPRGYRAG